MQRERVSAKSDSQLVVAHINACHGYLTREDMWVGQGVIVDLVSGSLASIVASALKIFRISFFYEVTISVLRVLCVSVFAFASANCLVETNRRKI